MTSDQLRECPFCGKSLCVHDGRKNPYAHCATTNCLGGKLPVVNMDSSEDIKAWNTRAQAEDGEAVLLARKGADLASDMAYEANQRNCQETADRALLIESLSKCLLHSIHSPRAKEAAEDVMDAARYRWLRDLPRNYDGRKNGFHVTLAKAKDKPREWFIETMRGLDLDQAIDAAMAKQRGESEHG